VFLLGRRHRRLRGRRLLLRRGRECLQQQQPRPAHQEAVGDVKDRPLDPIEVQEVPDAAEHHPVEQVAQGAGQDQAQGRAEPPVVGGRPSQAPDGNRRGRAHAHDGEEAVGQRRVVVAQAEQRPVVDPRQHRPVPSLERRPPTRGRRRLTGELRDQPERPLKHYYLYCF